MLNKQKADNLQEILECCHNFYSGFWNIPWTRRKFEFGTNNPACKYEDFSTSCLHVLDQVLPPLVYGITEIWSKMDYMPVCVFQPSVGADKQLYSVQVVFWIKGWQTDTEVIFQGIWKRIKC